MPRLAFKLLVSLVLLWPALSSALTTESSPDAEDSTLVAPVVLDGEVLFRLRGQSAIPARYRANQVQERIIQVADDPGLDPADIRVETLEDGVALIMGDQRLVLLFPADAEIEQIPLPLVANAARDRIVHAVKQYRELRSRDRLLRNTGILAGITILAALLFWGISALFDWLNRLVERRVKRHIKQLEQASHRVIDAGQIWGWFGSALRVLRALSLLALAMIWLDSLANLRTGSRPRLVCGRPTWS